MEKLTSRERVERERALWRSDEVKKSIEHYRRQKSLIVWTPQKALQAIQEAPEESRYFPTNALPEHYTIPEYVLEAAWHKHSWARLYVVSHPNAPLWMLEAGIYDKDSDVQKIAKRELAKRQRSGTA